MIRSCIVVGSIGIMIMATRAWSGAQLEAEFVASLDSPMLVTAPAGDEGRLFVPERAGRIRVIVDGEVLPDPFLDISDLVAAFGEGGLVGMAFHPDYATNGRFFLHYTAPRDGGENVSGGSGHVGRIAGHGLTSVIARYTVSDTDPDRADPESAVTVFRLPQPRNNHNAGWLDFGPNDGYLYVAMGDGGRGDGGLVELGGRLARAVGVLPFAPTAPLTAPRPRLALLLALVPPVDHVAPALPPLHGAADALLTGGLLYPPHRQAR